MKTLSTSLLAVTLLLALAACSSQPGSTQAATPDANSSSTTSASNESSALPFSGGNTSATEHKGIFRHAEESLTVPSGTPVTVRLQSAVSSETASAGDRFEAVLDAPLVVDGKTVAASGAAVSGKVVEAEKSGHLEHPGMIQIALSSITVNGKAIPISSSSVIARGASHKKRNLGWIGGGAAGGALIGGLAGGGKGALIGSAVGAGAGTGTAYATGKKDVGFGVERRLTFRLTQPITVKPS
jgi:hypothetical protein